MRQRGQTPTAPSVLGGRNGSQFQSIDENPLCTEAFGPAQQELYSNATISGNGSRNVQRSQSEGASPSSSPAIESGDIAMEGDDDSPPSGSEIIDEDVPFEG